MASKELYRVVVTYKDLQAHREWDEKLSAFSRNPRCGGAFNEPMPPPIRRDSYAAVDGAWGGDPLAVAAELAVSSVVGPRDSWAKFQAQAVSVEYIGSVAIQNGQPTPSA